MAERIEFQFRPIPELAPGEPGWVRPELPEWFKEGNEELAKQVWAQIVAELPTAEERRKIVEMENPRPSFPHSKTPMR